MVSVLLRMPPEKPRAYFPSWRDDNFSFHSLQEPFSHENRGSSSAGTCLNQNSKTPFTEGNEVNEAGVGREVLRRAESPPTRAVNAFRFVPFVSFCSIPLFKPALSPEVERMLNTRPAGRLLERSDATLSLPPFDPFARGDRSRRAVRRPCVRPVQYQRTAVSFTASRPAGKRSRAARLSLQRRVGHAQSDGDHVSRQGREGRVDLSDS